MKVLYLSRQPAPVLIALQGENVMLKPDWTFSR